MSYEEEAIAVDGMLAKHSQKFSKVLHQKTLYSKYD
jgi:hypothetical protein